MTNRSALFFTVWPLIVVAVMLPFAAPVGSAEPAAEQVARLAVGVADIETLDPHFATKIGEVPIIRMVYESLLRHPPGEINIEGIEPSLATKWQVGADKLTWTFYLRKGVQWHEGFGEFTADDVKFSIERIMDENVGSPFRKNLDFVEAVTIVDPYTIQIKTKQPVPDLPALMINNQAGFIVSRKAVEKLGKDLKYHPVGTGPFKYEAYNPRESFVLSGNDAYYRAKPHLKKVFVYFMPDNSTRELALRNGEVDAINIPAKQEWIDRIRKAGFEVNLTAPSNTFVLHFNLTKPPLDNIKVRQALSHAINREELIAFLGKDVARPEISPLPAGYVGHTNGVTVYEYNPKIAKQLLAEAGLPNGFEMSMNISNSDIYLPPMQVIQEQWKKIGVNLQLNVVDHPTYHKLIRQDVNPVVIYGAYRYPLTGNIYLTQFYHSESIVGKPTAVINFSHYGEALPGVDQYIDDARYELDAAKQKALWVKAQQQITRDAVSYPLFTQYYAMAKAPYLELGFEQKSWSFYDLQETSRILKH